jgi:hypothetical protein
VCCKGVYLLSLKQDMIIIYSNTIPYWRSDVFSMSVSNSIFPQVERSGTSHTLSLRPFTAHFVFTPLYSTLCLYAPLQHILSLRPFTAHFVLMAAFSLCMRFSLMFSFYVVPELLSSPPVFSEVRVTWSLVLCVIICWSLFALLSFPLYCLSFNLRF